ncbi:MAG: Amidophosphoribosyltransferase [Candidatus Woesebacteria bacterium GW2011_GWB1_39_12]|uniref:Amidophosphoribosyltransferase n=1 Tax=Candidatus Woesebacteria bacterium GW2011_GWB1_39_12 TaxID=1618574 RepID=A0A0G0M9U4_9BACT|nr:MAG: Amidophosphoribosyltransferase [Candidatus Woesebacteria bacterium GW2011_GWB1_39_12]
MCGIAGMYNLDGENVAEKLRLSLFALNHRGQEFAGICVGGPRQVKSHKAKGLVFQALTNKKIARLDGFNAIAHTRYSTTGDSNLSGAQPMKAITRKNGRDKEIYIVHNGNIPNISPIKKKLISQGAEFQSDSDTEVILKYLSFNYTGHITETLAKMMTEIKGSYSLLVMLEDNLYAIRDPMGNRPLLMGQIGERTHIFASETYAFDIVGGKVVRDVRPGEIVKISKAGVESIQVIENPTPAHCIFEWAYLQDSTSTFEGIPVGMARVNAGRLLAKYVPKDRIDIVIGVPETGIYAAQGLAEAIDKPLVNGISKNRFSMRTFIEPNESIRKYMLRMKLKIVGEFIEGKKICVVDDSIVRSLTARILVQMLKEYSPKEVHLAIATPPIMYPCDLGVSIKTKDELFVWDTNGNVKSNDQMIEELGVDSLVYLSIEDLCESVGKPINNFCLRCFNDRHPLKNLS